ncbi:hypothetical protein AAG906_021093 [Vitis piasezkii]
MHHLTKRSTEVVDGKFSKGSIHKPYLDENGSTKCQRCSIRSRRQPLERLKPLGTSVATTTLVTVFHASFNRLQGSLPPVIGKDAGHYAKKRMKDVYPVKQMCKATYDPALESGICSKLHGAVNVRYDCTRTAARFNLDDAFDQYGLRVAVSCDNTFAILANPENPVDVAYGNHDAANEIGPGK